MKNFDSTNLKTLRADINEAFKVIAEKHGISIQLEGIRYNDNSFTAKLSAATKGDGERVVNPKWKADYLKQTAGSFEFIRKGIKKEMFGTQVTVRGIGKATIVGAKPRNPELIVEGGSGKFYAVKLDSVTL